MHREKIDIKKREGNISKIFNNRLKKKAFLFIYITNNTHISFKKKKAMIRNSQAVFLYLFVSNKAMRKIHL